MDAEQFRQAGRRPTGRRSGLVDRVYADQLGAEPTDEDIYREHVLNREVKDPYAQEVGPGAGIMRGLDKFLGENVAEPLGRAGYPKIGAGISAGTSAIADLAIPQTAGDIAGIVIPMGKAGKALKGEQKLADKIIEKRPFSEPDYVSKARNPKTVIANEKARKLREDIAREGGKDVDVEGMANFLENDIKPVESSARSAKPLTKDEQAAKRAAENKQVMAGLKNKKGAMSEESLDFNPRADREEQLAAEKAFQDKQKSPREQMNERNYNARDVGYKKRLNDRAQAVKDAVDSGEVANPRLMSQDDLDTAWDHAHRVKSDTPADIKKILDDEKFFRFEARQKHGPAWRALISEGK